MNKRSFFKILLSTTIGLTATSIDTSALAASKQTSLKKNLKDIVAERRRNKFPNLPLLTHEGKLVRFYDDVLKDKIVLINFTYVDCKGICPGMTENLKKVYNDFGDRMGKDVFMYSFSLVQDSPEKLRHYREMHHIKDGWTFLTGTKADIEAIRIHMGFNSNDPIIDQDRSQHTGVVKFGIENLERWGMTPALGEAKFIAEYVRWMEPNGARPDPIALAA